jgi:GNAT superfamily N-acetyltransferase
MRGEIEVRPVAEADFQAWLPLWEGYNAFYGRSGETALPVEITRSTWARFFDPGEPVRAVVAEADGALVGLAHYLFHRGTISIEPTCYLQDLFTDGRLRGRGVGWTLIEAVYAAAREAGARRVYWQTHETNGTAMRLYDRLADKSGFLVYRKRL